MVDVFVFLTKYLKICECKKHLIPVPFKKKNYFDKSKSSQLTKNKYVEMCLKK